MPKLIRKTAARVIKHNISQATLKICCNEKQTKSSAARAQDGEKLLSTATNAWEFAAGGIAFS